MRRLLLLALLLAACSTMASDPTPTTAPLAEPSTTTTAPSTTTTEPPTTTTTEEECVERDGVLRNRRGFVCPPRLRAFEFVRLGNPATEIYLPGTYQTRLFANPLRFTRDEQFTSIGENDQSLSFEYPSGNSGPIMDAWSGDAARQFGDLPAQRPVNRPDDWVWVEDMETSEVEVGGYAASMTMFTANCLDESGAVPEVCLFDVPALGDASINTPHGERTAVIVLDSPEPLTITIGADQRVFDTYWAEFAQPILDSIEFVEP